MTKVDDATSADGSTPWFKIFESGYDAATDTWGNDVINEGCGKQELTIPSDIADGDYLLRAETIALHTAGQAGGAQFYMSCYVSTPCSPSSRHDISLLTGGREMCFVVVIINSFSFIYSWGS